MKTIAIIHENDIYPEKDISQNIEYSDRVTGKVFVLDDKNNLALVGNNQNEFLQLPGGGIDASENIIDGIIRECLEEIGCTVTIVREVARIDDFRPRDAKHCINYCYVAKVLGNKLIPKHTTDEAKIGMYTTWVSITEVTKIFQKQKRWLNAGKVSFYNTGFNIARDLLFLEYAKANNIIHE